MALAFFLDAALTQQITTPLVATQADDGSTPEVPFHLWLGDPAAGFTYQADSNPGVDQISIIPTDTTPWSGHETTEIKLATSSGGLTTATPGASLDVGVAMSSGTAGAIEFWASVNDATGVVGTTTELGLKTNDLRKS